MGPEEQGWQGSSATKLGMQLVYWIWGNREREEMVCRQPAWHLGMHSLCISRDYLLELGAEKKEVWGEGGWMVCERKRGFPGGGGAEAAARGLRRS